ncbi:response regulator [Heyndrickxia camelliae]|uniref:Two-component system response regulator n=1 Tax=Heyndrickxia camelliae TaxID=1707093 RepID=A0A2N3LDX5_9BACI|nr:response regulator [Heyndrickxia camelliae]PKR82747.1 two-component system response regulator [Heyndrickxia camelliae]
MVEKRIKAIIIDDDPMVREVNKNFIKKVKGFDIIGEAGNGDEGIQLVKQLQPDVVILDIYMPKKNGVKTLQEFRKQAFNVDVIVVSAARDKETINTMLQNGAVDFIIKPFKFERLKRAMENYRFYKLSMDNRETLSQSELDAILHNNQSSDTRDSLPKGLNMFTLNEITDYMHKETDPKSAEEVATAIGIARVTARRYLDYLEKKGKIRLAVQYGSVGRPINRYIMESKE